MGCLHEPVQPGNWADLLDQDFTVALKLALKEKLVQFRCKKILLSSRKDIRDTIQPG